MKNILLIEDDPFLIDIYTQKLKELDCSVSVALDGEEAAKKMQESVPDIVLLDIVLPNVDGWEILRKIKKNDAWKDVRVVVLSNLGQKSEVEKGLSLGAERYLIKAHYTPSQVIAELKDMVNNKKDKK